ncbi:trypsin-like serine peptidase [Roseovarius sp. C7]|uniref:trypsin-like serine peptidase n=1 Tax=Roseovarius sp. C7 TaxID=3398643 RepID=UPI0039F6CEC2
MMRRAALSLWLALATASLAGPLGAGSSLISLTERDDIFGWEAVGKLAIGTRGYCTGALIAPDLVLTAAHCVYDDSGARHPTEDLVFRAGLREDEFIAESGVEAVAAHRNYRPTRGLDADNIRHDVALLRLATPIPSVTASPFVLARSDARNQRVSVVSFGRGRDTALSWQRDCGVLDARDGWMAFDCNVTFGSSGAPVFLREDGRPRILSLISGGGHYDGRKISYGMSLPEVVARLKADLRGTGTTAPARASGGAKLKRLRVGQDRSGSSAKFARP